MYFELWALGQRVQKSLDLCKAIAGVVSRIIDLIEWIEWTSRQ